MTDHSVANLPPSSQAGNTATATTHPLTATDIKRAQDALQNDPFIMTHPEWIAAIKQLLQMGVRAEQQALAKWGLNYVIDDYLPQKLADKDSFLP